MPSRQRKYGGGKFKSERQRRFVWAVAPKAAKKWAHNKDTHKADWAGAKGKGKLRINRRRRKNS